MEGLNIRKLNSTDYDTTLVGWWNDWNWKAPLKDFLPENGEGGIIVLDGEVPICAGFMYATNSKVAWVDWIISSKTYNLKPHRREALKLLVSTLTETCKDAGYKYTYALIKSQSLIKVYEEFGYTQSDTYTTEMIKLL